MFSGFFSRSCGGDVVSDVQLKEERLVEAMEDGMEDDVEGLVWFESTSKINMKKLFETDSKRAVGAGTKIKIPPGRLDMLEHRLRPHGRLAKPVDQDSWSLFRALAFALGRRREASHVNIRNELVEKLRVMGDWPVLSPEKFRETCKARGEDENPEMNLVKTMFQKMGWPQHVNLLAGTDSPGDQFMLLAACCIYKTKICLVTATPNKDGNLRDGVNYDNPIWLAAPHYWRTCDTHEPWSVPTERSPIYIAHLHGCQFFALETQAQNSRNKNRQAKLESSRRIAAEKADRKMAEMVDAEDSVLPVEVTDEDRLKEELSKVLLPMRQPGEPEPTQEQLLQNEKVSDMLKRLQGDELFELLFEYKTIFDVFDYDSSGVMRIDEVVRAFRSYNVDLREQHEIVEGGYGVNKESLGYMRRMLNGQSITFTHFAKIMLAESKDTSPKEDLKMLINEMKEDIIVNPEDGERRVRLEDIDKVLSQFQMSIFDTLSIDPGTMKEHDGWIKVSDIEHALSGPQDL